MGTSWSGTASSDDGKVKRHMIRLVRNEWKSGTFAFLCRYLDGDTRTRPHIVRFIESKTHSKREDVPSISPECHQHIVSWLHTCITYTDDDLLLLYTVSLQ